MKGMTSAGLGILLGCALASCAPKATPQAAAKNDGVIAISITDDGFQPARSVVPKGTPLTLVFTRKSDQTCVTDVTFGRLAKTVALPLNQPVRVELPALEDTLSFSCPMDMYKGMLEAR
jgi:plastocyanin domain-containing protein